MSTYTVTWLAIIAAAALAWGLKLAGHAVPESWLAHPRVNRIAGLITVALLAALFAVQAFTTGGALALDARVAAIAVAVVLLALRAPFVVVVFGAAAVAALLRALSG